jgi:hypothetical protein
MAAMLASCSSDDLSVEKQTSEQDVEDGAVMFDAYVNRGTTRAGKPGELTTSMTTEPQISLGKHGFGVFAYYTDGKPYSETATPDFMYNQKVTYNTSAWTYAPVKYWPNEFGSSAISEGQDKLTFFAYAPYVDVVPGTGRVDTATGKNADGSKDSLLTSGIVGMTSNTATGDPYVKYYVDFDPDNCVDLCWGVAKTNFASSVDDDKAPNSIAAGSPYINVMKPKIADRINFDFKHALAALNVTIDADVDVESHATSTLAGATRIWVRSVTFEGFTDKGSLNLNAKASEGPLWYELSSTNTRIGSGSVTIYDGRRDGKEGQTNAEASNENPRQLNDSIIQSRGYDNSDISATYLHTTIVGSKWVPGVKTTAQNLFNSETSSKPIYVIPTDDELKITIVYDVETYDPNVAGYLSDGVTKGKSVENAITKNITLGGNNFKLEAGKKYTVALHLGMTSVKFDASVTEWGTENPDKTDLPVNARSIFVSPSQISCPAALSTINLTVKDQVGNTVSVASGTTKTLEETTINGVTSATSNTSWTWTTPSVEIPVNNTLYKKVYALQITKTDGGILYPSNIFSITQDAAVLTLTTPSIANGATSLNLASLASSHPLGDGKTNPSEASHRDWTKATIKITVGGGSALETITTGTPSATQVLVKSNGTLTFKSGTFTTGANVVIKVKAGDAAEAETSTTVTAI